MTAPQRGSMRRLRTRAQFQAVMAAGTLVRSAHFALHWLPPWPEGQEAMWDVPDARDARDAPDAPDALWLGPLAPKRWARRAVTRNAVRRQIYAVGAACALPPGGCVVRLRSTFSRQAFVSARSDALRRAVRAELLQLFAEARRKLGAPGAAA